ncbi:hypothetical protein [Luteimonas panaciterrae]|uniref:hypothetical protein n=1 Tax=Luteimonas panaciterrae TaxID=363885 RepID=UPI001CFBE46E|nr:hypothetical protein [Luteimonas panaciterrae]
MKSYLSYLRNGVMAVAVFGCLAFGASQALATSDTGANSPKGTCSQCRAECPEFGGQYISGRCYCCG